MTLTQIVGQFELVSQRQVEPICFGKGQILPNILTASNMKFVFFYYFFYREYFFSANASAAMAFLTCPWNDELLLVVMVMMLVV